MSSENISRNKRNKYRKIDEDKRLQIIEKINNGQSLKSVADSTGINISTCKAILKVYNEQGRVGKKKTRNKIVDVIETYSFYCLQNNSLTQLCPMKIQTGKISLGQDEDIDDIIKEKCKEKGEKLLIQTVETRNQINTAIQQTIPPKPQASEEPAHNQVNIPMPMNYYPYPFYYQ